jgi:ABC-type lipopolysaccharide export system ATPase subunit
MIHTLEADGIQLEFNGRRILSDIYIKCETGKITGLLGSNGQGKSCLMKIIYGSLDCEKSVRFDKMSQKEAYNRPDLLHYLPQFNFIPRSFTLKKIFNHFELDFSFFEKLFPEFASKHNNEIKSLSGGLFRLVELYLIIKSPSQFAMLDEPFTHLNPILIEKVKELMVEEKQKKGLLVSDHMYRHITEISDNLYVLVNGKIHLTKEINDIERLGYARF